MFSYIKKCIILLVLSGVVISANATTWTYTQIVGSNVNNVTGYGLNDLGQVVGSANFNGGQVHAFMTGPNGVGFTDLSLVYTSPPVSAAYSINNLGTVVGYTNQPPNNWATPTLWNGSGTVIYGGSPGASIGINDAGQIVNNSNGATLSGATCCGYGNAINATGQVVGYASSANTDYHAFITGANGIGMTDLGTLGGPMSQAFGVNDVGQVVGQSDTSTSAHAFITGPNGIGMTDIGSFGSDSVAYGINNQGIAVGMAHLANNSTPHAFITGANGVGMVDLNSLITLPNNAFLIEARAINNFGQILANSNNGFSYLLSVTAVPEADTYGMMLGGLGLIGFMTRRRKSN